MRAHYEFNQLKVGDTVIFVQNLYFGPPEASTEEDIVIWKKVSDKALESCADGQILRAEKLGHQRFAKVRT